MQVSKASKVKNNIIFHIHQKYPHDKINESLLTYFNNTSDDCKKRQKLF